MPSSQNEIAALEDLEPWVDRLRRCTHQAETHIKKLNLDAWITLQGRRKWRWVARFANTEAEAWTTQALRWDPTLDTQHNTRRRQGRPKTRWTDDIYHYIQHTRELTTYTRDQTDKNANSDGFI